MWPPRGRRVDDWRGELLCESDAVVRESDESDGCSDSHCWSELPTAAAPTAAPEWLRFSVVSTASTGRGAGVVAPPVPLDDSDGEPDTARPILGDADSGLRPPIDDAGESPAG